MGSRNKCFRCGRDPVIKPGYMGGYLCSRCFTKLFEKRVRKTIRLNKLLSHNDRIGVALSGGKDSAVALYLLKKITESAPKSEIVAVTIDAGIRGYNKKNIEAAKGLCRGLDVEQHIFTFRERFGFTMDEFIKKTESIKNKAPACSYCGVFRRKLLNEKALELNLDKIATGHNLDDEVQTALMNYIRGDFHRIARMGPRVGVLKDKGFIPRIKPLNNCPEEEIRGYADIKKLEFEAERCPYSGDAFRQTVHRMVDMLEEKHPGSRFQIQHSTENLRELLTEKTEFREINRCSECGDPTSGRLCKACEMIKELHI